MQVYLLSLSFGCNLVLTFACNLFLDGVSCCLLGGALRIRWGAAPGGVGALVGQGLEARGGTRGWGRFLAGVPGSCLLPVPGAACHGGTVWGHASGACQPKQDVLCGRRDYALFVYWKIGDLWGERVRVSVWGETARPAGWRSAGPGADGRAGGRRAHLPPPPRQDDS